MVAARTDQRELFADCVLEIREFRSQTLATDPEDFANFETFSMAMVDLDYNTSHQSENTHRQRELQFGLLHPGAWVE